MKGVDGSEKRLILILNKIDLVPGTPESMVGESPQILPNTATKDDQGTSATPLEALKSFTHAGQLNRLVSVGVIGYPNVGKLSVINTLTGHLGGLRTACPTGAEAAATRLRRHTRHRAAKVVIMDWRNREIQGSVDPPNCGPYDYQGIKPATAVIMTDDRKEIVNEEFELYGL
ncbi:hypothetical protein B9Z19DRAFT_1126128 [Tuber borchii]|uniref:G domain-containing protein n=1 Tax=Tuber borchii TaxID=42251 RepID=A0A2T6ZTH0_TUBBO|nr:hypothetical protein B9Z19DRAFT_1126128 [Tuber borchii]